jgi:hypothetical protein
VLGKENEKENGQMAPNQVEASHQMVRKVNNLRDQ